MSEPVLKSPLNSNHLVDIQRSLAMLDALDQQITMARQAGINVDKQAASATDSRQKLLAIKNVYFPGQ